MNEQIRELVKKAGGEFWQRLENDVVNLEAFVTFDPPASLEKFAELIVKEYENAMNAMPRYARTKQFQDIENATIDNCIMAVKQHFGVEQ